MNHQATLIQVHIHIDSVFETITLNCKSKHICALHIRICLDFVMISCMKISCSS
jgi:hypothetical protein